MTFQNKYSISSKETIAEMEKYFATVGGRATVFSFFFFLKHLFKVGMLNETLGNLSEDEREMMAGWGLDVKRKEGWRDCSCVEATNTSMSARWLEQDENLEAEPVSEAMPGWCEVSG